VEFVEFAVQDAHGAVVFARSAATMLVSLSAGAAGNFRGRMPCGRRMPLMFKQSDNNEQLSSPDVTAHGPLI
jgi:hypothetical protein